MSNITTRKDGSSVCLTLSGRTQQICVVVVLATPKAVRILCETGVKDTREGPTRVPARFKRLSGDTKESRRTTLPC
jgi:hypothetical protein